ncbi:hypothetical protein BDV36DRAFT_166835 [Aspergillus pseudocaelatus]|uniref:Uncharacterized protein n=1 Tax=Aspergillus pseudocaelatus TaxID=1825620 RepID=A0ABQ6WM19_9EURO|nr:hypothetical protein BDV36DRAFT_166835 [Aspergillus pseudocaelatus]
MPAVLFLIFQIRSVMQDESRRHLVVDEENDNFSSPRQGDAALAGVSIFLADNSEQTSSHLTRTERNFCCF